MCMCVCVCVSVCVFSLVLVHLFQFYAHNGLFECRCFTDGWVDWLIN